MMCMARYCGRRKECYHATEHKRVEGCKRVCGHGVSACKGKKEKEEEETEE
jgi:hypothetical protein